jgi:hypothetical protein
MVIIPPTITWPLTYFSTAPSINNWEPTEGVEHCPDDRSDLQCGCERTCGSINLPEGSNSYECWKAMGLHSLLGT